MWKYGLKENWLGVTKIEFIAMIQTVEHFRYYYITRDYQYWNVLIFSLQFVELKGSVFKKFDKNNLFQVSCSDVRERFHLFALLFLVVVQTMKEYGWREGKSNNNLKTEHACRLHFLFPVATIYFCATELLAWCRSLFLDVDDDTTISCCGFLVSLIKTFFQTLLFGCLETCHASLSYYLVLVKCSRRFMIM